MKAIVFDTTTLLRLGHYEISKDWFRNFELPEEAVETKRVEIDNILYLIDANAADDSGSIVVISIDGEDAVLKQDELSVHVLERISTVIRSFHSRSVVIPYTWHSHQEGTLISVYGAPKSVGAGCRVHFACYFDRNVRDTHVFALTPSVVDFARLNAREEIYRQARSHFTDAVLTPAPDIQKGTLAGIVLSERLPQGFVQGADLDQWYKTKLTDEQREFVDKPYDGPVRLRGAAGTGKTISLIVKFLRDANQFEKQRKRRSFAFLTHSLASVDLVTAISESLDRSGLIFRPGEFVNVEIRTLYDLAHQHLRFDLDDLTPLSLDGREGRRLQYELIEGVLREMANSRIIKVQFSDISQNILSRWRAAAAGEDRRFISEVMNEFASVLDADSIRAGEERGERYAKGVGHRPAWLLNLSTEQDRRFILEVHRRYRLLLGQMNTLSVDQMVADFNSFLDSNRWDRIRDRQGYDALFVDELHLFTSIERQTLHKLIRREVDSEGRPMRPPIFMAYDLKQSPRDVFTEYGETENAIFTQSSGLQNSDLVKLSKVFRYTPQISEFLSDLDASFPAIDIPGEWEAYAGKAQLADGTLPELKVFRDDKLLFRSVFDEAGRIARRKGGRRVAVLAASEEIFDRYLAAAKGQYAGRILPIVSREPSSEFRHAGKRFIFSMPEYVAGLQFDTVFLIHVDAEEAPSDISLGERRRFISNIYLGSSRAEQSLKISASRSRGGASSILNLALERGTLMEVPSE